MTAVVGGRPVVREMYPTSGFMSQGPNVVHFGLGDAAGVESLTIRWPSGRAQVLRDLAGGRHIAVDEAKDGPDAIRLVVPGRTDPDRSVSD